MEKALRKKLEEFVEKNDLIHRGDAIVIGLSGGAFTFQAFLAGAFLNAVPALICHIVLVPVVVLALKKAKLA